jgi:hypothetical protein
MAPTYDSGRFTEVRTPDLWQQTSDSDHYHAGGDTICGISREERPGTAASYLVRPLEASALAEAPLSSLK